jgi:hypothetical protein
MTMKPLATPLALVLTLLLLAGCAGTPKAPSCEGPYRSLNPAHYDPVKESTRADVPNLPPNA